MPCILSEVSESIGTITLDHERRRNALGQPLPLVERSRISEREPCLPQVRLLDSTAPQ